MSPRARLSADLHPGTRSRPLYPPAADFLADLIVADAALPAGLPDIPVVTLAALPKLLETARSPLRLLAVGSEAHLWDVVRVATQAGLHDDEIALHPTGAARRVQCIHCKTLIDDVAAGALDCPGCGLHLLVRDHFSRRLAAFQGVAIHGATRGERT